MNTPEKPDIPAGHLRALHRIAESLAGRPICWVVTGSLGMALQGLPVTVRDIDLQTDRDGAYAIERRLVDYLQTPVYLRRGETVCSHFGRFAIGGVPVEVMGALQYRQPDGAWEEPAPFAEHLRWIDFDGLRLPVLALAYESEAYRKLGRTEKAELLRKWLQEHPSQ